MKCKRIIALILCSVITMVSFPLVHAEAFGSYLNVVVATMVGWVTEYGLDKMTGPFEAALDAAKASGESPCEDSPTGTHDFRLVVNPLNHIWTDTCRYCGVTYDSFLSAGYEQGVSEMQASVVHSNGLFSVYPEFGYGVSKSNSNGEIYVSEELIVGSPGHFSFDSRLLHSTINNYAGSIFGWYSDKFYLPDGFYRLNLTAFSSGLYGSISVLGYKSDGSFSKLGGISGLSVVASSGDFSSLDYDYFRVSCSYDKPYGSVWNTGRVLSASISYDVECVELVSSAYVPPESTSRPISITGHYGIIGDNGQLTNIGTQTIVNEGSSTYYNPVTNTSYDLSGWTYDYSTRTYNLTTADDNSITVEYADESVNITEGDTVYNVYYVIPGPDQSACTHEYEITSSTDATCGAAGSTVSTCSLCGHTQTDTIPATGEHTYGEATTTPATCTVSGSSVSTCSTCGAVNRQVLPAPGHTWTIKQTVQTTYDETGALIQEGYIIFECSVCGTQSKSTDGTPPPSGADPGDPGGGSSGESIWDKLGSLLGTVGSGILSLIEAVTGKLLDGLISLAAMISEKLTQVVELVLSFFDQIPVLFGGFLSFLTALFPFIPDDMMLLLTFGLAAVVFVGILKAIRR